MWWEIHKKAKSGSFSEAHASATVAVYTVALQTFNAISFS